MVEEVLAWQRHLSEVVHILQASRKPRETILDTLHTPPTRPFGATSIAGAGALPMSAEVLDTTAGAPVDELTTALARLSAADSEAVQSAAARIRTVLHRGNIEIGRQLAIGKKLLPHGAYERWVETELGISTRSARRYLANAGFLAGKSAKAADLPQNTIERLAAKRLDAEAVDVVIAAVEDGRPSLEIERRLNQAERDAEEAARIRERALVRTRSALTPEEVKARQRAMRKQAQAGAERVRQRLAEVSAARDAALPAIEALMQCVAVAVGEDAGELLRLLGAQTNWEPRQTAERALVAALRARVQK